MTRRPTDEGLAAEAARYRRRLSIVLPVLEEFQTSELRRRLDGVLADYDDFERFIGRENVLDSSGRIDDRELAMRVADLLRRKPYLAARVGARDVGRGV